MKQNKKKSTKRSETSAEQNKCDCGKSKYEWLTVTFNTHSNSFDKRHDNKELNFKVRMTGDMSYNTIIDAAYESIGKVFSFEMYPDLDITKIEDENGNVMVSSEDKNMIESLKKNDTPYREFREEKYVLTPEGLLMTVLDEHGIVVKAFSEVKSIFADFMALMEKHGYVKKNEED